ncbi:MAG: response regulator [Chloracidobacterium sp.]|nr:response regulator [Chloracidobacterium sp.]
MPAPTLAPSSKLKGSRILIADENPATLEFFSRLLEDRGFTTMTADSGEAVLQFLSGKKMMEDDERDWEFTGSDVTIPPQPLSTSLSVILIGDLMKPPIDGLDLIRRLRSQSIPIVVATSYGADYTLLAKMAGAEVIIHKFADPIYLLTTIEGALQSRIFPPFLRTPPK